LIRDWESALWLSWFVGFYFVLFRWIRGREVVDVACSFG